MKFDLKTAGSSTYTVASRLEGMHENLAGLMQTLNDELMAWQAQDMNRRYPHISERTPNSVATKVWRTSRKDLLRRHMSGRPRRRRSIRPVVREELMDQLRARVRAVVEEAVQWR
jgi:hypothetical protein